jgi:poly-gamma-glutamate capsule biosynthesis protein CapA/YwtB (metallophosphatase superfamily)
MAVILIGGDVCPGGLCEPHFRNGQANVIFNDLLPELEQADYRVINLECPLILEPTPIEKDGPILGATVDCINGLKAAKIDGVNLANNHILDHGEQGLRSTITACQQAGIDYWGAGENLTEAGRISTHQIDGYKVGFLGVAEHEFSIAGKNSCGTNPLDPIENVRSIKRIGKEYDYLIAFVHGGRERYRYPNPALMNYCRFLVEEGASAVICQHSHCPGCYELYEGAPIVYGQGNFIFEHPSPRAQIASWYEGLLVRLILSNNGQIKAEWIPFSQSLNGLGARRLSPAEEKKFISDFETRSREISIEGAVEQKWLEYCRKEKYLYASRIHGYNRWLRYLNRRLHLYDWLYSKNTSLMLRNVVECETHRDALITLWKDKDTKF